MPVDYVIAYEISQSAPDWPFACAGLVPLFAGAVIIWGKRRFKWAKPHWFFAMFCVLFGVFWISVVGFTTIHADSAAYNAYKNGDYQTIEGNVTNFHPMPYEGHQDECFSVGDQRFCYSDYEIAPGFHNSTSHGGPIRAGLPVRIAYRDGQILKLEVPKGDVPSLAQSAAIASQGEQQWQQRAENDPFEQEMATAALFTAACWTLWWNLKWKQAMRFWVKPPYRPWVELAFRIFFALNFIGAVVALIRQLHSHPVSQSHILTTVEIAGIMCAVVALMSAFTLWMAAGGPVFLVFQTTNEGAPGPSHLGTGDSTKPRQP